MHLKSNQQNNQKEFTIVLMQIQGKNKNKLKKH